MTAAVVDGSQPTGALDDDEFELRVDDYRLSIAPSRGGSVTAFEWRGEPLMRTARGPFILDAACFPLVPFSNRIAFGRFSDRSGRLVRLAPNFPRQAHPHPLHGFGWLSPWIVEVASQSEAVLSNHHVAGEWPWTYEAEQRLSLSSAGFEHGLSVRNLSAEPMPAGLGFHPYFPRDCTTRYLGLHRGRWTTAPDGLPVRLEESGGDAVDWFRGEAVGTIASDTVFEGREGELTLSWPDRDLELAIRPSVELSRTAVFVPPGLDFFCVEPVTNATDAINRDGGSGMRWLAPGERMSVSCHYEARRVGRR